MFRATKPEDGETFVQFSVRLGSYLQRWLRMANIAETYHDFIDLVLRDQFLNICKNDMTSLIKERTPSLFFSTQFFINFRLCSLSVQRYIILKKYIGVLFKGEYLNYFEYIYTSLFNSETHCKLWWRIKKSPVKSQISRHCLGDHHWWSLWGVLAGVGDDHGAGLGHLLTGLGDDHWSPWHQGGSGLWDLYGVEDGEPGGVVPLLSVAGRGSGGEGSS